MTAQTILLATQNDKKRKELAALAAGRFLVRTLKDAGLAGHDVVEDGDTFAANARKKAEAALRALPEGARRETFAVVADDSGLVVDALDGKPGVRSARFAADHGCAFLGATADEANNALLLTLLAPVAAERRGARFVAHVCAIVVGSGERLDATGAVEGAIAKDLLGAGGFGYDPLFIVSSSSSSSSSSPRRMAELSAADKHAISHRGHAMRELLAALERRAVFARARPPGQRSKR